MKVFALLALCLLHTTGSPWTDNQKLRDHATQKVPTTVPRKVINLDLPPMERWTALGAEYKSKAPAVIEYLENFVPKWAMPVVEAIAAGIRPYFSDYGDEMIGVAKAMGLKIGDVVAMNLIYQLESLGLNCSTWNNTGPTVPNDPGCMAVDPDQKWCYCKNNSALLDAHGILRARPVQAGPGLCTSVVAEDAQGHVHHGRNLDWNLPTVIRDMVVDIEFQRANRTVFVGTGVVGFMGLVNGMRLDAQGRGLYSTSIDARGKGGKVLKNLLEALTHKAMTPAQHLRKVFETQDTFDAAMDALATGPLVNEIYYISAGSSPGEGMVISRDRNNGGILSKAADRWALNTSAPNGWFRLETNYDHWEPAPKADDRRNPGNKLMEAMGRGGVNNLTLYATMKTWPVFNHHTDYTGVFSPALTQYNSIVWLGDDANAGRE